MKTEPDTFGVKHIEAAEADASAVFLCPQSCRRQETVQAAKKEPSV